MATDYEKVYQASRRALGEPTQVYVDFFQRYEKESAHVLDVGCGQGRDALFIARLGHHVTAIDWAPSGIRDLSKDAAAEDLDIDAEVIDIRDFKPKHQYDIVVIDRTLHMLKADERLLRTMSACVCAGGVVLLADERSNIPAFLAFLDASEHRWQPILQKRGYLFVYRD
ncbi:MAG: methyltransferase domain-containing protein [Pseudomonadota bacterium]